MTSNANRITFADDEECYELQKLRETAKIASIYHRSHRQFVRNKKLTHVVHASLNFSQFFVATFLETFHHVHHTVNRRSRKEDEKIPVLPEERNPIFFLYPICMLLSLVYAVLWLLKWLLPERPVVALTGCAFGACFMLLAGIMEMKHADWYIDINEVSDEELLQHPVFLHNFIMCILSILTMTIYLIQSWLLYDIWSWVRKCGELPDTSNSEYSSEYTGTDETITVPKLQQKVSESSGKEQPGKLDPIPALDKFPSRTLFDRTSIEDEPVILYCCFVDWYNYWKECSKERVTHEFQVIHIL